jgi:hypothetical protein
MNSAVAEHNAKRGPPYRLAARFCGVEAMAAYRMQCN